MSFSIVLLTIAALIILEALFVMIFPHKTKEILYTIPKSLKGLRKIAIIELIAGLILVILAILTKNS